MKKGFIKKAHIETMLGKKGKRRFKQKYGGLSILNRFDID
jgi:hypothetical protein